MSILIEEVSASAMAEYARVPIAFEVRSVLEIESPDDGLTGLVMRERRLAAPYIKDYDAFPGEGPLHWGARFDIARWGFFMATLDGNPVGGAAVALATDGLMMLEGRDDLAVLWDIRVSPETRGGGIGGDLFAAAEALARDRGCSWLKVETQNVNVPACRFYRRRGCVLGGINRFAYRDLPDETQLLWYGKLR